LFMRMIERPFGSYLDFVDFHFLLLIVFTDIGERGRI
jgi:hypothetical protein